MKKICYYSVSYSLPGMGEEGKRYSTGRIDNDLTMRRVARSLYRDGYRDIDGYKWTGTGNMRTDYREIYYQIVPGSTTEVSYAH